MARAGKGAGDRLLLDLEILEGRRVPGCLGGGHLSLQPSQRPFEDLDLPPEVVGRRGALPRSLCRCAITRSCPLRPRSRAVVLAAANGAAQRQRASEQRDLADPTPAATTWTSFAPVVIPTPVCPADPAVDRQVDGGLGVAPTAARLTAGWMRAGLSPHLLADRGLARCHLAARRLPLSVEGRRALGVQGAAVLREPGVEGLFCRGRLGEAGGGLARAGLVAEGAHPREGIVGQVRLAAGAEGGDQERGEREGAEVAAHRRVRGEQGRRIRAAGGR